MIADVQYPFSVEGWAAGTATTVAGIAAVLYAANRGPTPGNGEPQEPKKPTDENLTTSLAAAIPLITQKLNLELATATEDAIFTRSSKRTVFWGRLHLGTSIVQMRVPVTHQFHIGLREPWDLRVQDNRAVVQVPVIRTRMPPTIHWDRIERVDKCGRWRVSPKVLRHDLEQQFAVLVSQRGYQLVKLGVVRETCRLSVAEFIRLWLEREQRWGPGRITAIHVRFADETTFPSEATLKLGS
jgi:hypothetical protein